MIPGSTTGNFYGVYMEIFKTKLGKKILILNIFFLKILGIGSWVSRIN